MTVLVSWLALAALVVLLVVAVVAAVRGTSSGGVAALERGGRPRPVAPVHPVQVESLRDRLGHDVRTLSPGADPVCQQALADAAERLTTCSLLLQRAESDTELRTAWLAAVEGLTASRLVRVRQGLDPGPEIPLPPDAP